MDQNANHEGNREGERINMNSKTSEEKESATRFKTLRDQLIMIGKVPGTCREEGPYYYSRNGGRMKERAGGFIAREVKRMVKSLGIDVSEYTFPVCSWCSEYPRTIKSMATEQIGQENFCKLFWILVDQGVLNKSGKIRNLTQDELEKACVGKGLATAEKLVSKGRLNFWTYYPVCRTSRGGKIIGVAGARETGFMIIDDRFMVQK